MKKNYIQPAVEVIELAVESGFQASQVSTKQLGDYNGWNTLGEDE